jgi:hypothetical protein
VSDPAAARGAAPPGAGAPDDTPLLAADLLAGAGVLTTRLEHTLARDQHLDAFLLAAGLSQLVEDRLHPDPLLLYRAASYLRGMPSRPARVAGRAAGVLGAAARARPGRARRPLLRARHSLDGLTARLAGELMGPDGAMVPPAAAPSDLALAGTPPGGPPLGGRAAAGAALAAVQAAVPFLAGDVLRIPACFHGFDQHPDDVAWLAAEFRRRYPAAGVPLCVVGVRTSGSYLAPLHAAALRAAGYARVSVLTYRPGRPFLRWERDRLAAAAKAGGLVLVTDDPPGTGTSMAAAARAAGRAGFPDPAVVLLFSSFGDAGEVPRKLRRWPSVVQPWRRWSIHRRLAPGPVTRALGRLAGPDVEVAEVRPSRRAVPAAERGHIRARFEVRLTRRGTGETAWRDILAEGAGLGYFGRQAVAVAAALPGRVPRVYGFSDGLLYRDWLPGAARVPAPAGTGGPRGPGGETTADPGLAGPGAGGLAAAVAGYVSARQRALPAPVTAVDGMHGRDPAWEVAAKLLSGQFGPLAVPARPLLLEPVVRRLLRHRDGAVLDGKTDARHWLPDPAADGALRKVDFYQRGFGHLDLACYDPVFDLAGAAADPPRPGFEAALRAGYRRATGATVDGERWLLYRLAQLWRLGKAGDLGDGQVHQRSATAVAEYLAGLYLSGLPPASGPLCAIDLDGVLECDRLGYPVTSPTGALALRALIAHGYQPVLVSGRSLGDVGDRCAALGLRGGVAEYGAALWLDGEATDLRPPPARALLDRARAELAGCRAAAVDPRYRHSIRVRAARAGAGQDSAPRNGARQNGARQNGAPQSGGPQSGGPQNRAAQNGPAPNGAGPGGQGPLPGDVIRRIGVLADPGLRVIPGLGQTDVTAAALDKGTGLAALAARLSQPACALAVGDAAPDLPMFARAALARAPRNARPWVNGAGVNGAGAGGAGIAVARHAYQAGLLDACAALIGHRPGHCPACLTPAFPPRTRALLAILDLRADGLATIPTRAAALATLAYWTRRWLTRRQAGS